MTAREPNRGMLDAYGIEGCGCWECVDKIISKRTWPDKLMYPFIVCATCGNKRCPHAESHTLDCTGSNEPGQHGSARCPTVLAVEGALTTEGDE